MGTLRNVSSRALTSANALLKQAEINLDNWAERILSGGRLVPKSGDRMGERMKPDIAPERTVECLQTIIDGFEDEVLIIRPDFGVRQANNAVLQRLGTSATDIMGKPCFQVSHNAKEPCHSPWCECPLRQVLETGRTIHLVHTLRQEQANEDEDKWIEIVASPLWDGYGRITEVVELMKDISESKKLQKGILRANRELLALNTIARALTQSLDLKPTLQAVAEAMLDALDAQLSWVRLSGDPDGLPTVRASRGLLSEASDGLVETMSNVFSSEPTTSATYSVEPNTANGGTQTVWQFAVTPLKSKGVILGTAGVATDKRPLDQQRIQLLEAIGNQITVAIDRCRLYEEVQLAREQRGELLYQVITAQEQERKRIARELHDETGQTITALRLCLEKLALAPATSIEEMKALLAQPLNLCQQADEEVDKLIYDLRPALLDDFGVVEAIAFYADTRLKPAGVNLSSKVIGKQRRLSDVQEAAIFRVVQEGISNIIKHAQAKNVTICLQFEDNQLVAQIEDDGCGFNAGQVASLQNPKRGLGLLGMRERINLAGGSLHVMSRLGAGTCIKAVMPLNGKVM